MSETSPNAKIRLKVSKLSEKFEFKVFSIVYLNEHIFWYTEPILRT